MKIVVLDGNALNPGDLSWSSIEVFGELTVYDRTSYDMIIDRAYDAEIVLTNKCVMDKDIIDALPNLRYIGVQATGYNIIDVECASMNNIIVTNVPAYSTEAVAQMVFAHILNFTRRVADHAKEVRKGEWASKPDFAYWTYPQEDLDGKNLGIIGYGNIGKAVARIGAAFGMNILVDTRRELDVPWLEQMDRETVMENADYLALCCPATAETEELINKKSLALMKNSAILINTGRGQLVNEEDLAEALSNGVIAGAGLDVLTQEPPEAGNPLTKLDNCFITPHNGWATLGARKRLMNVLADNILAYRNGRPINVVS